jgi:hypothetical protein
MATMTTSTSSTLPTNTAPTSHNDDASAAFVQRIYAADTIATVAAVAIENRRLITALTDGGVAMSSSTPTINTKKVDANAAAISEMRLELCATKQSMEIVQRTLTVTNRRAAAAAVVASIAFGASLQRSRLLPCL